MAKSVNTTNGTRVTQRSAMVDLFNDGHPRTVEQLREDVEFLTGRAAAENSIKIQIAKLRKTGMSIVTDRAQGVTTYQLEGQRKRKRRGLASAT